MKFIVLSLAMVACILSVNGYSFKRTAEYLGDEEKALLRKMAVGMTKQVVGEDGAKEIENILAWCLDQPLRDIQCCVKGEYSYLCERDNIDKDTCKGYESLLDVALEAGEALYRAGCHDMEGFTPSECAKEVCMPYCQDACEDNTCDCNDECDQFGSLLEENENEVGIVSKKKLKLQRLRSILKIKRSKVSSRRSRD